MSEKSFREKMMEIAEPIDMFPELSQEMKDANAEIVRLTNELMMVKNERDIAVDELKLHWTSIQDGFPEKNYHREVEQRYLVRVQDVVGGFLRDSYHFEVCDFSGTMCYASYFNIQKAGIVTHWMKIPTPFDED